MPAKDGETYYLRVGERPSRHIIKVKTAVTEEALKNGLSGRLIMQRGNGLLFIFPTLAKQSMWMKGMHFPLDIVWLDETFTVRHIVYGAPPCKGSCPSYSSHYKAQYAIELNAGDAVAYGFKVGIPLKVVNEA